MPLVSSIWFALNFILSKWNLEWLDWLWFGNMFYTQSFKQNLVNKSAWEIQAGKSKFATNLKQQVLHDLDFWCEWMTLTLNTILWHYKLILEKGDSLLKGLSSTVKQIFQRIQVLSVFPIGRASDLLLAWWCVEQKGTQSCWRATKSRGDRKLGG